MFYRRHQLNPLKLDNDLTFPPLISAKEGMMSNLINSEAFATIGSRCMDMTAVTLPSFAW